MSENFLCPGCKKSFYNAAEKKITLKGVLRGKFFEVESLFELNHQIGEFGGKALDSNIKFGKGAKVDFYCPNCGFDLTAEYDKDLAEFIHSSDDNGEKSFIINKISGREMSFIICKDKKEILESYGKDKDIYLDKVNEYFNKLSRF